MPTLKIIYDRDKEIENFESSKYYKLIANFLTKEQQVFEAIYYENENEKYDNRSFLESLSDVSILVKLGIILGGTYILSKVIMKKNKID